MKPNPFLNINKASNIKTNNTFNQTKTQIKVDTHNIKKLTTITSEFVVENIFDYVKNRIEIGVLSPIELTDVYGLSIYVGMVLPEQLKFKLNNDVIHANKGDFIVFDFDGNISHVAKDNFRSFYRLSKVSKEQQLMSAINLFKLNTTAEQLSIKETINESARASEDEIFKELAEQIMKGKVDKRLLDSYKTIIESKYKNELINYVALSGYKAKYFISLLKKRNIPFALLTPLVDSIVNTDDDLDIDEIAAINSYIALIATVANGVIANAIADCLKETNEYMDHKVDCIDVLTYAELIDLKAQLSTMPSSTPIADRVLEQIKEEVIEQHEMFGANDVLVQDYIDVVK